MQKENESIMCTHLSLCQDPNSGSLQGKTKPLIIWKFEVLEWCERSERVYVVNFIWHRTTMVVAYDS